MSRFDAYASRGDGGGGGDFGGSGADSGSESLTAISEVNATLRLTPEPQQQQRKTRPLVRRISSSDRSTAQLQQQQQQQQQHQQNFQIASGASSIDTTIGDYREHQSEGQSRVLNLPPAIQVLSPNTQLKYMRFNFDAHDQA